MGTALRVISRYRPRLLTLFVLAVVAVPGTLANLSYDVREPPPQFQEYLRPHISGWNKFEQMAYGWPLTWRGRLLILIPGSCGTTGWHYSEGRLAANIMLWAMMLAIPAGLFEWLLRRYRPRPRWSLRTLLAVVALVAACCSWIAAAWQRANMQEPLIAEIKGRDGRVVFERWGPKWLDLLGADRFRRQLVGVSLGDLGYGLELHDNDGILFRRLAELPRLRYLSFRVDHRLTPGMASAVGEMRRLRYLHVSTSLYTDRSADATRRWHAGLREIGKLTQLEELCLDGLLIEEGGLAALAGLANLRSLSLDACVIAPLTDGGCLVQDFPALPRLEWLNLTSCVEFDEDLRHLRVLNALKGLKLSSVSLTRNSWAELRHLEMLEEISIDEPSDDEQTWSGLLDTLRSVKRLRTMHLDQHGLRYKGAVALPLDGGDELSVLKSHAEATKHALQRLREAHPGITIDCQGVDVASGEEIPWETDWTEDYYAELQPMPPPFNVDGLLGWSW